MISHAKLLKTEPVISFKCFPLKILREYLVQITFVFLLKMGENMKQICLQVIQARAEHTGTDRKQTFLAVNTSGRFSPQTDHECSFFFFENFKKLPKCHMNGIFQTFFTNIFSCEHKHLAQVMNDIFQFGRKMFTFTKFPECAV